MNAHGQRAGAARRGTGIAGTGQRDPGAAADRDAAIGEGDHAGRRGAGHRRGERHDRADRRGIGRARGRGRCRQQRRLNRLRKIALRSGIAGVAAIACGDRVAARAQCTRAARRGTDIAGTRQRGRGAADDRDAAIGEGDSAGRREPVTVAVYVTDRARHRRIGRTRQRQCRHLGLHGLCEIALRSGIDGVAPIARNDRVAARAQPVGAARRRPDIAGTGQRDRAAAADRGAAIGKAHGTGRRRAGDRRREGDASLRTGKDSANPPPSSSSTPRAARTVAGHVAGAVETERRRREATGAYRDRLRRPAAQRHRRDRMRRLERDVGR